MHWKEANNVCRGAQKNLQMVQDGKISAEQAASLMRRSMRMQIRRKRMSKSSNRDQVSAVKRQMRPSSEAIKARARRFAMIPLWIGVALTVLERLGYLFRPAEFRHEFLVFFLMIPLLIGVLFIALGASGQTSRWLYVNVDRRNAHDGPRKYYAQVSAALGLTAWFLRTFGQNMRGMKNTNVDEIIQLLDATGKSGALSSSTQTTMKMANMYRFTSGKEV